jgi:4-oxalocrotonate tautomerase
MTGAALGRTLALRVPVVSQMKPDLDENKLIGGMKMPLIQVKLIEKVFTPQQKQEMIKKLTDAMVSIEGENMRQVTWVVIEDVNSGDWGIGGQPLSTEAVKALAAGKA